MVKMDFWFLFHYNAPQDRSGAAQMGQANVNLPRA